MCRVQSHGILVVFYWDQPFQPKPVLVETVEVPNRSLFFNRSWFTRGCDRTYFFCQDWQDGGSVTRNIGCPSRTARIGSPTL